MYQKINDAKDCCEDVHDASDVSYCCEDAQKEFENDIDTTTRENFLYKFEMIANGVEVKAEPVNQVGAKAVQLKRNGRPAKRCIYVVKDGKAVILHPYVKKTNGVDKKAMAIAARRYKAMGFEK